MFRYENIPGMVRFLEERLGEEIRLPKVNVSPSRAASMSFRRRCGRGSSPSAPRTSRSMPISPGEAVADARRLVTPAPDFLCIGAQKAGTSWLDVMLRQHPGVFLPPMKEVHFYDFIYLPEHRGWIRTGFRKHLRQARRARGLRRPISRGSRRCRGAQDAWYAAVFDHPDAAGRVTGEITPAYSILPAEGVARVRATNPAMKIVFIVRDPVDRALSQPAHGGQPAQADVGSISPGSSARRPTCCRRRWRAAPTATTSAAGRRSSRRSSCSTCRSARSAARRRG